MNVTEIEVVYARDHDCDRAVLTVPEGTTLREAILLSALLQRHPELDADDVTAGVFGRIRTLEDRVTSGDRVEIYRRLLAEPRQARRQRVRIARRKTR